MKLDVLPLARADLVEIARFGRDRWGDAQSRRYAAALRGRMADLAAGRTSGTAAADVAPGLRKLVCGSHVVWFLVAGDRLRVLRVLHASRDAARHLGAG